jgi:hypothetical protein
MGFTVGLFAGGHFLAGFLRMTMRVLPLGVRFNSMKKRLCFIPVLLLLLSGCHKQATQPVAQIPDAGDSNAPAAAQADGSHPAAPLPPPPAVVAANADNIVRENVSGEVDPFLTQQLRIFVDQYNRIPQSFAEFAGHRLDSMPRAPEGMKYVIDRATVEVKSIPK